MLTFLFPHQCCCDLWIFAVTGGQFPHKIYSIFPPVLAWVLWSRSAVCSWSIQTGDTGRLVAGFWTIWTQVKINRTAAREARLFNLSYCKSMMVKAPEIRPCSGL